MKNYANIIKVLYSTLWASLDVGVGSLAGGLVSLLREKLLELTTARYSCSFYDESIIVATFNGEGDVKQFSWHLKKLYIHVQRFQKRF